MIWMRKFTKRQNLCWSAHRYIESWIVDLWHQNSESEQYLFSYYILNIWSHAYAMRQRDVLNDAEWRTYTQWMTNCFRKGTMSERLKHIEEDRYLNPAFQNFINTEIMGASGIST
ncbi:MAG: hypothetical protein DLM72_13635 [Candidatus Nitrosopolaris wilkensis]|nr:MAG: hypothetical protein DLM72_13635 [Candidatus Nitrosopolaris wilkensis]